MAHRRLSQTEVFRWVSDAPAWSGSATSLLWGYSCKSFAIFVARGPACKCHKYSCVSLREADMRLAKYCRQREARVCGDHAARQWTLRNARCAGPRYRLSDGKLLHQLRFITSFSAIQHSVARPYAQMRGLSRTVSRVVVVVHQFACASSKCLCTIFALLPSSACIKSDFSLIHTRRCCVWELQGSLFLKILGTLRSCPIPSHFVLEGHSHHRCTEHKMINVIGQTVVCPPQVRVSESSGSYRQSLGAHVQGSK